MIIEKAFEQRDTWFILIKEKEKRYFVGFDLDDNEITGSYFDLSAKEAEAITKLIRRERLGIILGEFK